MNAPECRLASLALALCVSCGLTTAGDRRDGSPEAQQTASSTGNPAPRRPVEYFEGELPEPCETSELRITSGQTRTVFDTGYREQLIWTTSWDSFYIRTHTLPLSEGGLIAGWGEGGARFEDGETRSLDKTLVLLPQAPARLYCAGGNRRVIASGGKGYVTLTGLSGLGCGESVEGSLTYCSSAYCNDETYDSYMLHGSLDGRDMRLVTGEKDYRDSLINFSIGYSFLVASTTLAPSGELGLEKGAFLDLVTGELYCMGTLHGTLEDGAIGQVTFSDFRRALPCEADPDGPRAEACFERDQSPE